jgi:hypothetical protein
MLKSRTCDVDSRAVEKVLPPWRKAKARSAQGVKDFRRMLEDKSVDAIFHLPHRTLARARHDSRVVRRQTCLCREAAAITHESELMVAAARQPQRVVQMGNQRRRLALSLKR